MPSAAARRTNARKSARRAEVGVHGVVAARGAADRPRRARVVRARVEGVVAALAVRDADRVDRRQVDDVEAHRGDAVEALRGGAERAALPGAVLEPPRALRAREELVPGADARTPALDEDLVLGRVGRELAPAASAVNTSRTGASTSARRSATDAPVSRSPAASAVSRRRVASGRDFSATARSMRRAPISYISSASTPASIFRAASCRQVAISSSKPVTCQCQTPCSSRSAWASHRSVPAASGDIRSWRTCPDGLVSTSIAPTWSWPSRKTVARNGTTSPSKAFGPPSAVGQGGGDPGHWDPAGEDCVGGHVPTVARNRRARRDRVAASRAAFRVAARHPLCSRRPRLGVAERCERDR